MRRRASAVMTALTVTATTMFLAMPAMGDAAAGEAPGPVAVGNEGPARFIFHISPRLLPARDPGATDLRLTFEESPSIGSGIAEAKFGLDRSIRLDRGDLPVCHMPGINFPQVDATGVDLCPRAAIVGHAEALIEVALPESKPIVLSAHGNVYVGGTRLGVPILMVDLPVGSPLGGRVAFLAPIRTLGYGRIGSEITFTVPTLAGGHAFFLGFGLDLQRGFTDHGEPTGYVSAECRNGKVKATFAAVFTDGTRSSGKSARACSRRNS